MNKDGNLLNVERGPKWVNATTLCDAHIFVSRNFPRNFFSGGNVEFVASFSHAASNRQDFDKFCSNTFFWTALLSQYPTGDETSRLVYILQADTFVQQILLWNQKQKQIFEIEREVNEVN